MEGFSTLMWGLEAFESLQKYWSRQPSFVGKDSYIFNLYDEVVASKMDFSGRRLNVTLVRANFPMQVFTNALLQGGL